MNRENNSPLPADSKDQVVEVLLKHVLYAFGALVGGSILVGTSITVVRDWIKLKRQKSLIEAAGRLLFYFKEGDNPWKKETTASLSQMKTSNK
ncbi:hypothetical protein JXO59_04030 [candidate division KSB1 bacterium]|nr:hypothetical protein [candidate division KSB1 bacterium]